MQERFSHYRNNGDTKVEFCNSQHDPGEALKLVKKRQQKDTLHVLPAMEPYTREILSGRAQPSQLMQPENSSPVQACPPQSPTS